MGRFRPPTVARTPAQVRVADVHGVADRVVALLHDAAFGVGRGDRPVTVALPAWVHVQFDAEQEYGSVGGELADDRDGGDEPADCDDLAVVGPAWDDLEEIVESEREVVLDGGELEAQEVDP